MLLEGSTVAHSNVTKRIPFSSNELVAGAELRSKRRVRTNSLRIADLIYQIDEGDSVNFFIEYEDGTQDIRRAESVELLDDFLDTESDSESDSIQNLDTLDEAGGAPLPELSRPIVTLRMETCQDDTKAFLSLSSIESIKDTDSYKNSTPTSAKIKLRRPSFRDSLLSAQSSLSRDSTAINVSSPRNSLSRRGSLRRNSLTNLYSSQINIEKFNVRVYTPYIWLMLLTLFAQVLFYVIIEDGFTIVLLNLFMTGLVRHTPFKMALYYIANYVSRKSKGSRFLLHKCIHCIGGVHSVSATSTVAWIIYSLPDFIILDFIICICLFIVLIISLPCIRAKHHNLFEYLHRYFGWTALALTWVVFLKTPRAFYLWLLLIVFTYFIIFPWLWVQHKSKAKGSLIHSTPSDNVIIISFKTEDNFLLKSYPIGVVVMISLNGVEWHPFAVVQNLIKKGYASLVIAARGDFTKSLHEKCKNGTLENLFVRSFPKPGHQFSLHGFDRIIVLVSGAGIGAALQAVMERREKVFLFWICRKPSDFGVDVIKLVNSLPHAFCHETTILGRPTVEGLCKQMFDIAVAFQAGAVFLNCNQHLTYNITQECIKREMVCFGTAWDH